MWPSSDLRIAAHVGRLCVHYSFVTCLSHLVAVRGYNKVLRLILSIRLHRLRWLLFAPVVIPLEQAVVLRLISCILQLYLYAVLAVY